MTQSEPKLKYFFLFPKDGEGFSMVVTYGSVRVQMWVHVDECQEDLAEVLDRLPRLVEFAFGERDVQRALLEMDQDLDDLLGEGEV
jgi:hypothetical protein